MAPHASRPAEWAQQETRRVFLLAVRRMPRPRARDDSRSRPPVRRASGGVDRDQVSPEKKCRGDSFSISRRQAWKLDPQTLADPDRRFN
ncbi:hypothetical protein PR048_023010 [Dryococelus australis]|uniref:Uncharacterized protein n=1 Tax=Dryococelus australis TaxID=614101 RepID=A0ABQ9GSU7_9NEOP|nr:hypothetical protein PR048_023010 [Dryococelus australis]